jgi:g-D-glutamyl-meso-diaminopimelate peptidase
MTKNIEELAARYPNLISYKSIGTTTYGREIWAVKLGSGKSNVFINGSHHAREWLTTNLTMYMVDQYVQAFVNNTKISGFSVREILQKESIWFVPMVNPDGVTLQQRGANAFPESARADLIKMNGKSADFTKWKANAEGVDPNRQYDADWEHITDVSPTPKWMNYKGSAPVQTNENKSMVAFTTEINPEIALSYHSAGQILFWNFHTKPENLKRDKTLASAISTMTGYELVKPKTNPSGGGYTDWFIQTLGKPAFTAEIGTKSGEEDLPLTAFGLIWKQNKGLGLYIANEGYKLWDAKSLVTQVDLETTLFENTQIYHTVTGSVYSSLSPQTVHAFQQKGDWYHIQTWAGDHWIHPILVAIGVESVSEDIVLDQATDLYNIPFKTVAVNLGSISPQVIHVVAKWQDWYKIKTWLGEKWIEIKPKKEQSK